MSPGSPLPNLCIFKNEVSLGSEAPFLSLRIPRMGANASVSTKYDLNYVLLDPFSFLFIHICKIIDQNNNDDVVIDATNGQDVYVLYCKNSTISIKGSPKSVVFGIRLAFILFNSLVRWMLLQHPQYLWRSFISGGIEFSRLEIENQRESGFDFCQSFPRSPHLPIKFLSRFVHSDEFKAQNHQK